MASWTSHWIPGHCCRKTVTSGSSFCLSSYSHPFNYLFKITGWTWCTHRFARKAIHRYLSPAPSLKWLLGFWTRTSNVTPFLRHFLSQARSRLQKGDHALRTVSAKVSSCSILAFKCPPTFKGESLGHTGIYFMTKTITVMGIFQFYNSTNEKHD